MKPAMVLCIVLGSAACSAESSPQKDPSDTVRRKIGDEAARAVTNPAAPVDIVADDAVLRRIIARDRSISNADIEQLYAGASGTQYVKDFEILSRLPPAGLIQFRSADRRYLGAVQKRQGEANGERVVRYEVAVWQDPVAAANPDDQQTCYRRVAAYTQRQLPKNYNPENDPDGVMNPETQAFDELGAAVSKQGDLRKKGAFCTY